MKDIVDRLDEVNNNVAPFANVDVVARCRDAADVIHQLRVERAEIHRALTGTDGTVSGETQIGDLAAYVRNLVHRLQDAERDFYDQPRSR